MKTIALFITGILFHTMAFANSFDDYQKHIAPDRLMLIFNKDVPVERQAEIIRSSGLVKNFGHLPSPSLTICFTDDVDAAQKSFITLPEIKFVSFFITDGENHYAGVLDDFFVKLADKNFESMLQEKLKQKNLGPAVPDTYIPNLYKVSNSKFTNRNTIDWCADFLKENWVVYAAPDYLLNPIVTSNDPLYSREWNIKNVGTPIQGNGTVDADMEVDSAWTLTTGNPAIKVSIIDSGVDTLHEDLMQNLLPGHDAVSHSTDGYPTPDYPEDGHGTCCAGIVAAVKENGIGCTGVAPLCKIIPVRSFYYVIISGNLLPYSTASTFAEAIGWSWDSAKADILSNSWGLPPDLVSYLPGGIQPVNDAIQQAYISGRNGKGVAMFFSSGNDNTGTGPIWPAYLPQSISVNATNMCDSRKSPTDCSGENWGGDYGPGLDFSAPGVKITTTDMLGSNGFSTGDYYYLFNGTSAACPNAAAVGALLLSIRPQLSADEVRNIIAQTCDKTGGYGYDSVFTNGTWCPKWAMGVLMLIKLCSMLLFTHRLMI